MSKASREDRRAIDDLHLISTFGVTGERDASKQGSSGGNGRKRSSIPKTPPQAWPGPPVPIQPPANDKNSRKSRPSGNPFSNAVTTKRAASKSASAPFHSHHPSAHAKSSKLDLPKLDMVRQHGPRKRQKTEGSKSLRAPIQISDDEPSEPQTDPTLNKLVEGRLSPDGTADEMNIVEGEKWSSSNNNGYGVASTSSAITSAVRLGDQSLKRKFTPNTSHQATAYDDAILEGRSELPLLPLMEELAPPRQSKRGSMKGKPTTKMLLMNPEPPGAPDLRKPPHSFGDNLTHRISSLPEQLIYSVDSGRPPRAWLPLKSWWWGSKKIDCQNEADSQYPAWLSWTLTTPGLQLYLRNDKNALPLPEPYLRLYVTDLNKVTITAQNTESLYLAMQVGPHGNYQCARKLKESCKSWFKPSTDPGISTILFEFDDSKVSTEQFRKAFTLLGEMMTKVQAQAQGDKHVEIIRDNSLKPFLEMLDSQRKATLDANTPAPVATNAPVKIPIPTRNPPQPKPKPRFNTKRADNEEFNQTNDIAVVTIADNQRTTRSRARAGRNSTPFRPSPPPRSPSPPANELLLVYPPSGTGAVNITGADYKRLAPGEFLNDTLIEFGLKWLSAQLFAERPELANEVHFFNSFFYKKLSSKAQSDGYQSVRKWTSKFDIFQKKYIVVPINENFHWYLAIIYQPANMLLPPPPRIPKKPRTSSRLAQVDTSPPQSSRVMSAAPTSTSNISQTNTSRDTPDFPPPSSDTDVIMRDEERDVEKLVASDPEGLEDLTKLSSQISLKSDEEIDELQSSPVPHDTVRMDVDTEKIGPSPLGEGSTTPVAVDLNQGSNKGGDNELNGDPEPGPAPVAVPEDEIVEVAPTAENPKTTIFLFDSLGGRHMGPPRVLAKYLADEAADKKKIIIDPFSNCSGKHVKVPYQPNYCDCGIYLLHFAETFLRDPQGMANKSMGKLTKSAMETLWEKDTIADKREGMMENIRKMSINAGGTFFKPESAKPPTPENSQRPEGPLLKPPDVEVSAAKTMPVTDDSRPPSKHGDEMDVDVAIVDPKEAVPPIRQPSRSLSPSLLSSPPPIENAPAGSTSHRPSGNQVEVEITSKPEPLPQNPPTSKGKELVQHERPIPLGDVISDSDDSDIQILDGPERRPSELTSGEVIGTSTKRPGITRSYTSRHKESKANRIR